MRPFGRNSGASLWRNRADQVVLFTFVTSLKVLRWRFCHLNGLL